MTIERNESESQRKDLETQKDGEYIEFRHFSAVVLSVIQNTHATLLVHALCDLNLFCHNGTYCLFEMLYISTIARLIYSLKKFYLLQFQMSLVK